VANKVTVTLSSLGSGQDEKEELVRQTVKRALEELQYEEVPS
jgi:hypothetical protein